MAIFHDLITALRDCPDATALEYRGQKISYCGLYEQASQVAAGLQARGLRHGSTIGIMLPNMPEFLAIAYGAFFSGQVVTPMSVLATPREVAHIVGDSALDVLFVHAKFLRAAEDAVADMADAPEIVVVGEETQTHTRFRDFVAAEADVAIGPIHPDQHLLTLYTSGTTGASKGVMISDRNMQAQVDMLSKSFTLAQGTRILCVLPLFHAYALNALVSTSIRNRATVVLQDRFEVGACAESLANDGIQWFAGVPTMYGMLLEHGNDNPALAFPALDVCLTGGAAMNREVLEAFEARFGPQIQEGYGLTETTVSVASNTPESRRVGSVGRPYPAMEAAVLDEAGAELPPGKVGELVFRGDNVMLGYLNLPDETAKVLKTGWLHSGDLGYIDDDGFCFIVGRQKDLIIKSGYNIVPSEVEEALRQADTVRDACVVGIPDTVRGERILAAIILEHSTPEAVAMARLKATMKAQIAKYKHPNEVWFVDAFPLGPTGKILKKSIREAWLAQEKAKEIEEDVRIPA